MANEVDGLNSSSKQNGNVILIDPISVNTNPNIINGIPQYQDMYIFAELTAKRRGRTIIINNSVSSVDTMKVNLMGMNGNDDNPNQYNFTTNYYDGSMGNGKVLESFGISNINIKVNSSYVPQVSIQFVDIRGLSFFNQEDSPYRILFDFPPPTFTLTVKGYYGKALTYELHLVKYTSEFQAETGNYVIDANFVAMTFAPLSDVLFRYIVNAPLMIDGASANPQPNVAPKNTNDLILKLKNLYSTINERVDATSESKRFDNIKTKLEQITSTLDIINGYADNVNLLRGGNILMIVQSLDINNLVQLPAENINEDTNCSRITNTFDYDNFNGKSGNDISNRNRLLIGFVSGSVQSGDTESNVSIGNMQTYLNEFKNVLTSAKPASITATIPDSYTIVNKRNLLLNKDVSTKYVVLDITDFYVSVYKNKVEIEGEKLTISNEISRKVNSIVVGELGMLPTIYNIFKIILDDVDVFFRELKKCAYDAEIQHNVSSDYNIIVGNDKSVDINNKKIYAFPLIINKSVVSGGNREERIAPIELSKRVKFPEIDFVRRFIDTFQKQREINDLLNAKKIQNDEGIYNWIPFSPIDSELNGGVLSSPYIDVIGSDTDTITQIYRTLLKRYYMITQGVIPDDYVDNKRKSSIGYQKLFAQSEAINLSSSIAVKNADISNLVKEEIKKYGRNIDAFYTNSLSNVIDENGVNLYSFNNSSINSFNVDANNAVYVSKNDPNYIGLNLYDGVITLQHTDEDVNTPINEFKKNAKREWYQFLKGSSTEYWYEFTNQNVIYIGDVNNKNEFNGINFNTRYIGNLTSSNSSNHRYSIAYQNGNNVLGTTNGFTDKSILNNYEDYMEFASVGFALNANALQDESLSSHMKALLILSNFGSALSPFNKNPNGLNELIFNAPAVIEVPKFVILYMGALVHAINNGWESEINEYMTTRTAFTQLLFNSGSLIGADLHDIKKYLSVKDKQKLEEAFVEYFESGDEYGFNPTFIRIKEMLKNADDMYNNKEYKSKNDAINKLINPIFEGNNNPPYYDTVKHLIERGNIVAYSQITFSMNDYYVRSNAAYESLKDRNGNAEYSEINKQFFTEFFRMLNEKLSYNDDEAKKNKEKEDKIKGDVDILTQTYYSFKNINDKWLTSQPNSLGYPYNRNGKSLIDSFAFVDRAMNPIGDTIINAELLTQILDNPDVSVFTALSQLLSANGFEFFPLQNFMSFEMNDKATTKSKTNTRWEDCFKINTGSIEGDNTAFVCMYIGGSSSNLSVPSNGFVNDGIVDISNPGVSDYSTQEPLESSKEDQELNWKDNSFPWRQVRAFRVRFGEQNQSMFTNIKIDSKEYPETNESIQILSRLAGDNGTAAPTPKGQNLYNLYENRSYSATVTGLGNAMIQPTQYFQLENVPLYNGAYIILNVEHNITANKMMTTFSGTKMIKYPSPRVLSPVTFVGFDDITNTSGGELVQGALLTNYPQTQYNSMYTLKIN